MNDKLRQAVDCRRMLLLRQNGPVLLEGYMKPGDLAHRRYPSAHGVGAGQARSAPRGGEAEKDKNEEESEEEEECGLARATHIAD